MQESVRLHSHQYSTNHHDAGSQQTAAHLPFTEEQPCPENGEDGTELEEGRDIADEPEGNRREPEERSDSCQEGGSEERPSMKTKPIPGVLGT